VTEPIFFERPEELRSWLEENHETAPDLWVGFYKKAAGKPSITWSQAVDEALSFGWIDSLAKGIDEHSHRLRFTPRRPGSTWSKVNIAKVAKLAAEGRMRPAGLRAFEARSEERSGTYSFEQENVAFTPEQEAIFRAAREAWDFFAAQAPSYRKAVTWWVIGAKKEETRTRRLGVLIEHSAAREKVPQFAPRPRR
jgi:uncharacterized protein YdeI (YjbR/CyaY-like superfamily)